MIGLLENKDINAVCKIVNDNWQAVYAGIVNDELINEQGCIKRKERLEKDFLSGRLLNYIYKEDGKVIALVSIGDTEDADKRGAFEVWRIYITKEYQNKGIGHKLLQFAEEQASKLEKNEIVIWAFKENKRAISFYKKHGYIIDKEKYLGEPYLAYCTRFNKKLT